MVKPTRPSSPGGGSAGDPSRLFTASLRAAHRCVSVEIHRASSPGGGSSLTRLVSRASRPHRENWPASALTRVPPPAVHRVASRRSSLRFGRNTLGPVLPVGASSLTRLVSRTPTGRTGPRPHRETGQPRRSRGFHHRLLKDVTSGPPRASRASCHTDSRAGSAPGPERSRASSRSPRSRVPLPIASPGSRGRLPLGCPAPRPRGGRARSGGPSGGPCRSARRAGDRGRRERSLLPRG